jgi:hypothetical protein
LPVSDLGFTFFPVIVFFAICFPVSSLAAVAPLASDENRARQAITRAGEGRCERSLFMPRPIGLSFTQL